MNIDDYDINHEEEQDKELIVFHLDKLKEKSMVNEEESPEFFKTKEEIFEYEKILLIGTFSYGATCFFRIDKDRFKFICDELDKDFISSWNYEHSEDLISREEFNSSPIIEYLINIFGMFEDGDPTYLSRLLITPLEEFDIVPKLKEHMENVFYNLQDNTNIIDTVLFEILQNDDEIKNKILDSYYYTLKTQYPTELKFFQSEIKNDYLNFKGEK